MSGRSVAPMVRKGAVSAVADLLGDIVGVENGGGFHLGQAGAQLVKDLFVHAALKVAQADVVFRNVAHGEKFRFEIAACQTAAQQGEVGEQRLVEALARALEHPLVVGLLHAAQRPVFTVDDNGFVQAVHKEDGISQCEAKAQLVKVLLRRAVAGRQDAPDDKVGRHAGERGLLQRRDDVFVENPGLDEPVDKIKGGGAAVRPFELAGAQRPIPRKTLLKAAAVEKRLSGDLVLVSFHKKSLRLEILF